MRQEEYRIEERIYELWLCSFPSINNRQMCGLAELCGGAREVYFSSADKWRQVLSEKQVESLKQFTKDWRPEEEYKKCRERGIRLVTLGDKEYPARLREIPDAPYGLFVRGDLPGDGPAVAVVGARDCSGYGSFVAKELGKVLGRHGIIVVSGMARGVDGICQQAALDAGGISWGVLGCGVDICYPRQNEALYDRLPRQGCLVSSYPQGTPAIPRNFPPRNRIVSGLADAVIVVEAREKSGTLITVDMALEQGREVYAVPGRITDRLSDGCNRLIRQGAAPLLNPEEFVREFMELRENHHKGKNRRKAAQKNDGESDRAMEPETMSRISHGLPGTLSPELEAVYQTLELTAKSVEEIRKELPVRHRDINLNACLIRLCLEGLAVQVSSGHFAARVI